LSVQGQVWIAGIEPGWTLTPQGQNRLPSQSTNSRHAAALITGLTTTNHSPASVFNANYLVSG